jgi:hypothetical protein
MTFENLATLASFSAVAIALAAQAILVMLIGTRWADKGTAHEDSVNYKILLMVAALVLVVGLTTAAFLVETDLLGKSARELGLCLLAGVMMFVTYTMHQWLNQIDEPE